MVLWRVELLLLVVVALSSANAARNAPTFLPPSMASPFTGSPAGSSRDLTRSTSRVSTPVVDTAPSSIAESQGMKPRKSLGHGWKKLRHAKSLTELRPSKKESADVPMVPKIPSRFVTTPNLPQAASSTASLARPPMRKWWSSRSRTTTPALVDQRDSMVGTISEISHSGATQWSTSEEGGDEVNLLSKLRGRRLLPNRFWPKWLTKDAKKSASTSRETIDRLHPEDKVMSMACSLVRCQDVTHNHIASSSGMGQEGPFLPPHLRHLQFSSAISSTPNLHGAITDHPPLPSPSAMRERVPHYFREMAPLPPLPLEDDAPPLIFDAKGKPVRIFHTGLVEPELGKASLENPRIAPATPVEGRSRASSPTMGSHLSRRVSQLRRSTESGHSPKTALSSLRRSQSLRVPFALSRSSDETSPRQQALPLSNAGASQTSRSPRSHSATAEQKKALTAEYLNRPLPAVPAPKALPLQPLAGAEQAFVTRSVPNSARSSPTRLFRPEDIRVVETTSRKNSDDTARPHTIRIGMTEGIPSDVSAFPVSARPDRSSTEELTAEPASQMPFSPNSSSLPSSLSPAHDPEETASMYALGLSLMPATEEESSPVQVLPSMPLKMRTSSHALPFDHLAVVRDDLLTTDQSSNETMVFLADEDHHEEENDKVNERAQGSKEEEDEDEGDMTLTSSVMSSFPSCGRSSTTSRSTPSSTSSMWMSSPHWSHQDRELAEACMQLEDHIEEPSA